MSDTPRTDGIHQKNIKSTDQSRTGLEDYIAMLEHAQTLELENAELLAAFKKIDEFTDLEMRDGDSARELSAAMLIKLGEL
jgi:RNase P/RNase MRP subunit p29